MIKNLFAKILDTLNCSVEDIWFVPAGYITKSGSVITYFFRVQNNIPIERFILSNKIKETLSENNCPIVFLDDFIGTGKQAVKLWHELFDSIEITNSILFTSLVGFEQGINYVNNNSEFKVIVAEILNDSDLLFSEDSKILENQFDKQEAKEVLTKYGKKLFPNAPLGFSSSGILIGFFYSTPNNTPPIFWSSREGWIPLLPRAEKTYFTGTQRSIKIDIGVYDNYFKKYKMINENVLNIEQSPISQIFEIDELEIEPDNTLHIIREFRSTSIYLILARTFTTLKFNEREVSNLIELIKELKYAEHENIPLHTSILIIPNEKMLDIQQDIYLPAAPGLTLKNVSEIKSFASLIDGIHGTVVFSSKGNLLGNALYEDNNEDKDGNDDPFIPDRLINAKEFSRKYKGILFGFLGNGRIIGFYDGFRILTHRGANWAYFSYKILQSIEELSKIHKLNKEVLLYALKLTLIIADNELGTILTIGDHENVLKYCDPPKTSHFTMKPIILNQIKDEAIIGLMTQDGATLIGNDGSIIQCMTFLRPPPGIEAEEEVGRGSKHSTALKITKITNTICIAGSVSGSITLYSKGKKFLKLLG